MRSFSRSLQIPAGGCWPQSEGGRPIALFRWVSVENRSAVGSGCDLLVSYADPPNINDPTSWAKRVPAGCSWQHNVAGEGKGARAPHELEGNQLRLLNIGSAAVTCWLELDTEPISDSLSITNPANPSGTVITPAAGLPMMSVGDASLFTVESTAALGAAASFVPAAWHDAADYNWFAALSLADVAGTLWIDESPDNGTTISSVASQAAAAPPAGNVNAPAGGFVARLTPTKTVCRYVRVRYVNGAGAQARFNLQSALSPLN